MCSIDDSSWPLNCPPGALEQIINGVDGLHELHAVLLGS
jgi:hypothetical protein